MKINNSDIALTDKYFYPSDYKVSIKVSTEDKDALIEILYTFDDDKIDIINNTNNYEYISKTKNVTLIEYIPHSHDNKTNLEIYIRSNEDFTFGAYGGISKDNYFYYSKNYNLDNNFNEKYYFIRINDPLKDIELEPEEKYYISLVFVRTNPEQEIKISLTNYENIIETLYEPIDEIYIDNVISNLTYILTNYIFLDIIKNPPAPEGHPNYVHRAIDLNKTLNNINRTDRKFYDFYREIREDLGVPRNLQLRIYGLYSTKKTRISYMTACLPFSFYVDKDSNNETKIYIKYFEECAPFFNEEIINFVQDKANNNISLKEINGKDPFDYIQEWGRIYQGLKSPHGHFTLMKTIIHAFYIRLLPYNPDELKMKLEFEGNKTLNLDYYIYMPDTAQMFIEDNFESFFESEVKSYQNKIMEPNIFELIKKYKKQNGLLKEENKEIKKIEWDYQSVEEDGIRCRVDNINKINVLVQESFNIDLDTNVEVAYKCTKLFHQNNYRIVVIENLIQGGMGELGLALRQLLQVKIKNRSYLAFKPIPSVGPYYSTFYDSETCSTFKSEEDFFNGKDIDYSTETEKIIHKKTKVYDQAPKSRRTQLEKFRKEFLKLNTKKPTDIIIFVDPYAYGAGSIFTKAIQNEGAAITVGFNGNPNLEKDIFDSSQSPGPIMNFANTATNKNLNSLGFTIRSIATGESYEDDYVKEKAVSREYKLDAVDERVDIYESYTDDKYDIFIKKAEEIFSKYNEQGKCNPNNTKLILDNDTNCAQFDDDTLAHGGYKCGSDGYWSSTCQKYYCELGYYYNVYRGKCMRDYCTNEPKEINITLNGSYEKTIILNSENNDEYIFILDNNDYSYSFETNLSGFIYYNNETLCPTSFVVKKDEPIHNNKIYVNYYKNITKQEIIINIKSTNNKVSDEPDNHLEEGLPTWAIILIVIGSLLIIAIIILLILKLKARKLDSDNVDKLFESKTDEMVELNQKN